MTEQLRKLAGGLEPIRPAKSQEVTQGERQVAAGRMPVDPASHAGSPASASGRPSPKGRRLSYRVVRFSRAELKKLTDWFQEIPAGYSHPRFEQFKQTKTRYSDVRLLLQEVLPGRPIRKDEHLKSFLRQRGMLWEQYGLPRGLWAQRRKQAVAAATQGETLSERVTALEQQLRALTSQLLAFISTSLDSTGE